jgi:hypothetical protein
MRALCHAFLVTASASVSTLHAAAADPKDVATLIEQISIIPYLHNEPKYAHLGTRVFFFFSF